MYLMNRLDFVALNPQPIPPGRLGRFEWVLLNPQPLPPRALRLAVIA